MANLKKLGTLCAFLGQTPNSFQLQNLETTSNSFYNRRFNRLNAALLRLEQIEKEQQARPVDPDDDYPKVSALYRVMTAKTASSGVLYLDDNILFALTRIAESKDPEAGYACYILGCIYEKRFTPYKLTRLPQSDLLAAYYFCQAMEKRYFKFTSQKSYAEACARLGWFDAALKWFPTDSRDHECASAFLAHRVRFAKENGITFPENDSGFVRFREADRAAQLRQIINEVGNWKDDLPDRLQTLNRELPDSVLSLYEQLYHAEADILRKKRRARRMWWLLPVLLALLAIPGLLMGNGEGIQGIFYKIFMCICCPLGNSFTEGMSLAERLASFLDESARSTIYGAGVTVWALLTLVWITLLLVFKKKKYAAMYADKKDRLYAACDVEKTMEEIFSTEQMDPMDLSRRSENAFQDPNALAAAYHQAMVSKVRPCLRPAVFGDGVTPIDTSDPQRLLQDYDAFCSVMHMFNEKDSYLLSWSASDIAACYENVSDRYKAPFMDYFYTLMRYAADQATGESNKEHFAQQLRILDKAAGRNPDKN